MVTYSLSIYSRGDFMVGAAYPGGRADIGTSRDGKGRAYIPATALRGAFREAAEMIDGENGDRVSLLMGKKASKGGKTSPGILKFSDAILMKDDPSISMSSQVRPSVAMSRMGNSAIGGRHFQREVFPGKGVVFQARISCSRTLVNEEIDFVKSTLRLVSIVGIGGAKASGLGQLIIELDESVENHNSDCGESRLIDKGLYVLEASFLSRFRITGVRQTTYLYDTDSVIPGRTVRGAVFTAMAEDSEVEARIDVSSYRFSDLLPSQKDMKFSCPIPSTSLAVKYDADDDRCWDSLALQLAAASMGGAVIVPSEKDGVALAPAKGVMSEKKPVKIPLSKGISSHVEISRSSGTARSGVLWSYRSIEPEEGQSWKGFLWARTPLVLPKKAWIGGGRSRGYGEAYLKATPISRAWGSLKNRFDRFQKGMADQFSSLSIENSGGKLFWSMMLFSPMIPIPSSDKVDDLLVREGLPDGVKILFRSLRTELCGGFWEKAGIPAHLNVAYAPGGVVAGTVPTGKAESFISWAEERELCGIGQAREEGYGWVLFCHPWHLEGQVISNDV